MADPRPTNTGFYLPFGQALTSFRNALADQGIQTNIISGVRSPEEHQMAWDNFLVGQQNQRLPKNSQQPLPHPEFGPVPRATPPGEVSTHDVGLGADVQPVNRADLPRMYAMAPKFGIDYLGASDPYHFQMANWRQVAATEPPQMPWTQAVAEATGRVPDNNLLAQGGEPISATRRASAGGGFDVPPGTSVTSRPITPTPIPGGSSHADFIRSYAQQIGVDPNLALGIANAEGLRAWSAKNPNAASTVDVTNGVPWSFGDFQLNVRNGLGTMARQAGIDPADPNQWQAADKFALDQMKISLAPWKGDPVAEAYRKTGKVPALPAMPASDAAPAGATGATGTAAGGAGGTAMGFQTQAGEDAFLKAAKGFQKATGGGGDAQGQGGPPDIQQSPMVGPPSSAQNVSPLLAMVPMTYGQTINSLQDPLTWNSNPPGRPPPAPQPGAGVGRQGPMGTSLNSMAMMDPNMAQFPQSPITGMGYMGMGYGYPGGGMPYG